MSEHTWVDVAEYNHWSLKVSSEKGIVLAIREVPYDGQIYHSTENRRNDPSKRSEFQLSEREVVNRYIDRSGADADRRELLAKIRWVLDANDGRTCAEHGCDRTATHQAEVNAPGRGHGFDYYCKDHGENKQGQTYITTVRDHTELLTESRDEAAGAVRETAIARASD